MSRFKVTISSTFNCSLERAFKTPMLCDIRKVHTGLLFMPRVTHSSEDNNWGIPGSAKKIHTAPSITQRGGYASKDHVIERIENKYWKIQVDNFQSWILGFHTFIGEWETEALSENKIQVVYTYTLLGNTWPFYPLQWLFIKLFWPKYMRQVMENIRKMAEEKEP